MGQWDWNEKRTGLGVSSMAEKVVEVRLSDESIAALADALADRLRPHADQWLTAAQVAEALGVSRDTIYAKADELGARHIGDGPKARLRFPASCLLAADVPADPPAPTKRRRLQSRTTTTLLPIAGRTS